MDIMLSSEFDPGSTGVVHIGTMKLEPSGQDQPVAVKLAFSQMEKMVLEREHQIYSHLHSKGVRGIPQDLGLFVDDELVEDGEGPYALIMTFAGVSLHNRIADVLPSVKSVVPQTSLTCRF